MKLCYRVLWILGTFRLTTERQCSDEEFPCADGQQCINKSWFCDEVLHCQDTSDETRRNKSERYDADVAFCRGNNGSICVLPKEFLPTVRNFCKQDLRCARNEFPCEDGSKCLDSWSFCDGAQDCSDGSDEPPRRNINSEYDANFTFCRGERGGICVISNDQLPRYKAFCKEDWRCADDEFSCTDGSGCFKGDQLCDEFHLCRDRSDEILRDVSQAYPKNATFCRGPTGKICAPPSDEIAQSVTTCMQGLQCGDDEFTCEDGSRCMAASNFCDGFKLCRDASDDTYRDRTIHYDPGVTFYRGLSGHICVVHPQVSTAFKEKICKQDTDDPCQCKDDDRYYLQEKCFRCLGHPSFVVPISQMCDGIIDCPDLSDECICTNDTRVKICEILRFGDQIIRDPHLECLSPNEGEHVTISAHRICDEKEDCQYGEDERGCRRNDSMVRLPKMVKDYTCPYSGKYAKKCDGVVECSYFYIEECICPNNKGFCDHIEFGNGRSPNCDNGSTNLVYHNMCDGKNCCKDFGDERNCDLTRFYCTNEPLPNIPSEKRCDRNDDCPNGEDEMDCPNFYCDDNGTNAKYLNRDYVCDGFQDCISGRDECICVKSIFSSDESMIKNTYVFSIVWIISITAVVGCVAVILVTIPNFFRRESSTKKNASEHAKLVNMLIFSLSVSDLLVAIYTLAICIKALQFNQDYCKVDFEWRSSKTCSALGALLMIGSEQSVFTIVMIAVTRLISVLRPFLQPSLPKASLVLLTTWIISIFIGIIPLIPIGEDYFVKQLLFSQNMLLKMVSQHERQYFIDWLSLIHQGSNLTSNSSSGWSQLKSLAADVNPNITVVYEFGYYSTHTVCLPTLFPDIYQDFDWGYTVFVLFNNFLAFVLMLIVYIVLYKCATKNEVIRESNSLQEKRRDQNIKMQHKLTRIIVSDFLCWMPICIMGILKMTGVPISNDAYLPAGLLIIPLNSALNPLLYSDIPETLLKKLTRMRRILLSRARKTSRDVILTNLQQQHRKR